MIQTTIKILIVEDEVIISRDMSNMLTKLGYNVIGDALNYEEAIQILEKSTPDLILLDINLKGEKDGIDLAEIINKKYQIPIIYTTSYTDNQTLERAKKTNPINYLVKPFKRDQLFAAIEMSFIKANQKEIEIENEENEESFVIKDAIFIKDKYRYSKVNIDEILWIKSEGNYLEIHLNGRFELIRSSMDNILKRLNNDKFFRTQKSYIINLDCISKIETNFVLINTIKIPITKAYHDELLKKLNIV